jgi:ABC-type bacteriocin/lantibiotic exporter with double-glycine peptidase domain
LLAIYAGVVLRGAETFTTGNFIAFSVAYLNMSNGLLQMGGALISALNVIPLYERAKPIFETLPEVDPSKVHPGRLNGEIEVNGVDFRYDPDGPPVLHDVSFHVKPGEFVALVGSSGSGKSTLLRLLLGFEQPESGTIYYDGKDIGTLDIQEVRRQIGVVLQSGGVMTGTVLKNIIGTSRLTVDDAWEAARMVGLDEDINEMPMGMQSAMSVGGRTLSGGQRQRLLIARAIVHRPRMLFFDEATSALDNRTQAIVTRSLDNLQATRLVIAHRLSTIIHADRIIVLEKGRIVETGTYEALLNQGGLFAELARRQIA